MHHFIITGTSRGIGAALASQLLASNHHVYCMSRGDNPALREQAENGGFALSYFQTDLSVLDRSVDIFLQILQNIDADAAEGIYLVHNAAALAPISAIGKEDTPGEIAHAVIVNLTAPMQMTAAFVKHTQDWPIRKRVLNISSGAAKKAVHAWSSYCTTKAGLEMYSQCLAAEQATETHPITVMALAPGVVDTAMQDMIREQPKSVFHGVDRFLQLKAENRLWSPDFVAGHIAIILKEENFGDPVSQDLRHRVSQ